MEKLSFSSYIGIGAAASAWGFTALAGNGVTPLIDADTLEQLSEPRGIRRIPIVINASDLESKYGELPCLDKLFSNISWTENDGSTEITLKDEGKLQGCLSIWWNQNPDPDNNWSNSWNVLWGMSDGNHGTIFLSRVAFINGEARKVNEVLYVLEKEETKDTWKVLMKETEVGGSDSGESGDESSGTTELNLTNWGSGWNSSVPSSPVGQMNWKFIPRSLSNRNQTQDRKWIEDISKWLGQGSMIQTALTMYAEINGTFIEESWTI